MFNDPSDMRKEKEKNKQILSQMKIEDQQAKPDLTNYVIPEGIYDDDIQCKKRIDNIEDEQPDNSEDDEVNPMNDTLS